MITEISKVVRIGDRKFCKIEFKEGNLSTKYVDSPRSSGNAISCGCGITALVVTTLNKDWSITLLDRFQAICEEWHLNNMQAGNQAQRDYLKSLGEYVSYGWACEELKKVNLHIHEGYQYGTSWLSMEVPQEVLKFLSELPDTDSTPAWI